MFLLLLLLAGGVVIWLLRQHASAAANSQAGVVVDVQQRSGAPAAAPPVQVQEPHCSVHGVVEAAFRVCCCSESPAIPLAGRQRQLLVTCVQFFRTNGSLNGRGGSHAQVQMPVMTQQVVQRVQQQGMLLQQQCQRRTTEQQQQSSRKQQFKSGNCFSTSANCFEIP